MGLKQSIVVRSEFTVMKNGKGTRGSTPGDYVVNYMARNGATEDLTPVLYSDMDSYITRYMAREDAVESLDSVPEIKAGMKKAQGFGGVGFGYGDLSLSHEKLKYASRDIQRQFEDGKTVMKTVVSFTEDYLKENGVVDPDFELKKRGDYRGHIDQMKLRMAISHGMDKISKDYDDLQWVGVIQVDTAHVHCHLCMVDRGIGNIRPDGTQDGRLNEKAKRQLRRGIDLSLDQDKSVQMMSSNVTHDKRNALCFIKRFTHKSMAEQGMAQFLVSCLPEDEHKWRAGSNAKDMKKANSLVREYVMEVLNEPNSGYREALQSVDRYARARQQREGFDNDYYRKLYLNGQERIVSDCMNGVYAVLKQIPKEDRQRVRTPMLDVMSMDYEQMSGRADSDPMIEFGFKLRSYSSRKEHHKKETHKYREAVADYEATKNPDPSSRPMYDFFKFEEEYNAMLMTKYQYFLDFLPGRGKFDEEFEELMDYRSRMRKLRQLMDDPSAKRMSPESAEDYGQRVYGMRGGQYVPVSPDILDRRLEAMRATYSRKEQDFRHKLADEGLTLEHTPDDSGLRVSTKKPYEFDDVKALDMHHLGYDFVYDTRVSKVNVDAFVACADKRYELYQNAVDYLSRSGQAGFADQFAGRDIHLMKETADAMRSQPVLASHRFSGDGAQHDGRTVRLGTDYMPRLELAVKSAIQTAQIEGYE